MGRRRKGKKKPRSFVGVEALLVFPDHGDYVATLDPMRRFSAAFRYGYNRLLEGAERKELNSLSKDTAAAYVIGRRALGFQEEVPKPLKALLQDADFHEHTRRFYEAKIAELKERRRSEKNPYLKRRLGRELSQMRKALATLSSLQGKPGSSEGSTEGRNPRGANPWRALRAGTFLPLLGRSVPRDLSPLKPILLGSWEGWKGGLDPHPGGGSAITKTPLRVGVGSGGWS